MHYRQFSPVASAALADSIKFYSNIPAQIYKVFPMYFPGFFMPVQYDPHQSSGDRLCIKVKEQVYLQLPSVQA
jgi:hypothetical protein